MIKCYFLMIFQSSPIVSVAAEPSIHVRVEHSGLDTSHMKIEDFTSQQHLEPIEYVGIDHMEEICSVESPSGIDWLIITYYILMK